MSPQLIMILVIIGLFIIIVAVLSSKNYSLNNIKSKTVGDGQHGTARFATNNEIATTYNHVPFTPELWRNKQSLPTVQGIVVGYTEKHKKVYAIVDDDDIHSLMIGAAGVGKTAYFLYPNLEYACASGMSFMCTDTKGDLFRNYATIAKKYYDYDISVIDLRNPTRSNHFNMLHLVNHYMDLYLSNKSNLKLKAKAERYAKIIAKTIIYSGSSEMNFGSNQFFYDSAEGLLTSSILIISEFGEKEKRHIISVFKIIQDMMGSSDKSGESEFKKLINKLSENHKAKWFAGSALNTSDQSMQSILSTALARLNTFIDSELEQILCFATDIDSEKFCNQKCAIFLVMPEEDSTKYFIISLIIQQLYRDIVIADENGGKLKNRIMFYLDEIGTIPKIESAEMMFSASRSRRLSIVAIIQSIAQLERNYDKEGCEIIIDNCQSSVFGGFAPNSKTAEVLSKNLGSKTVLSGSVSSGRNDPTQSLQMIERPLVTTDELKTMPKGDFIVMKTGSHPMRSKLKLFTQWGIKFEKPYTIEENESLKIEYIRKEEIIQAITGKTTLVDEKEEIIGKFKVRL